MRCFFLSLFETRSHTTASRVNILVRLYSFIHSGYLKFRFLVMIYELLSYIVVEKITIIIIYLIHVMSAIKTNKLLLTLLSPKFEVSNERHSKFVDFWSHPVEKR